jgi:hypothetical protein
MSTLLNVTPEDVQSLDQALFEWAQQNDKSLTETVGIFWVWAKQTGLDFAVHSATENETCVDPKKLN